VENEKELTVRTNITHVLNVAVEVGLKDEIKQIVTEYNAKRNLGFVYKKLSFGDTPDQDILQEIDAAIEFIHDAHLANDNHHVLVHCIQGISRSASVVVGYLMKYENMSLREAHRHVRQKRGVADPRKEFVDQLGRFECKLRGLTAPSLTGEEVFAGRNMLNLDAPPQTKSEPTNSASSRDEIVETSDADVQQELDALQKVFEQLTDHIARLGSEAKDAAALLESDAKSSSQGLSSQSMVVSEAMQAAIAAAPSQSYGAALSYVARRYSGKRLTKSPFLMELSDASEGTASPETSRSPSRPSLESEEVDAELQQEQFALEALLDFMVGAAALSLDNQDTICSRPTACPDKHDGVPVPASNAAAVPKVETPLGGQPRALV